MKLTNGSIFFLRVLDTWIVFNIIDIISRGGANSSLSYLVLYFIVMLLCFIIAEDTNFKIRRGFKINRIIKYDVFTVVLIFIIVSIFSYSFWGLSDKGIALISMIISVQSSVIIVQIFTSNKLNLFTRLRLKDLKEKTLGNFLRKNFLIINNQLTYIKSKKHYTIYNSYRDVSKLELSFLYAMFTLLTVYFTMLSELSSNGKALENKLVVISLFKYSCHFGVFALIYYGIIHFTTKPNSPKRTFLKFVSTLLLVIQSFLIAICQMLNIQLNDYGSSVTIDYIVLFLIPITLILPFVIISMSDITKKLAKKFTLVIADTEELIWQGPYQSIQLNPKISNVQRDLLFAIHDNKQNGAVMLSGPWGSGKTHTTNDTLGDYHEVDLLKFGSGQNVFYSTYKSLSSSFSIKNFKINLLSLSKNIELFYIVIAFNLSWIPFVAVFKDLFIYNGELIYQNMLYLHAGIIILNLAVIQFLPDITFSKDVENNRFRQMYLDLIVMNCIDKILVFENIDRLNFEEINSVLELINYLNDAEIKVVVNADLDYLKRESKFNENKFKDENNYEDTFSLYLSRYFKDVIYIQDDIEYKLMVLKDLLEKEDVFVALYEWYLIRNILKKHNSRQNIRELKYFVKKYSTRPVMNQFSYELFLHINNVNNKHYMDYNKLSIELKKSWEFIVYTAPKDIVPNYISKQSSKDYNIDKLLYNYYHYSNIPFIAFMDNKLDEAYSSNLVGDSEVIDGITEMQRNPIFHLKLNGNDLALYNAIKKVEGELIPLLIEEYKQGREWRKNLKKYLDEMNSGLTLEAEVEKVLCKLYIDYIKSYRYDIPN